MNNTYQMTYAELDLFGEIIWKLSSHKDNIQIRIDILPEVGKLLKADVIASGICQPGSGKTRDLVGWNLSNSALKEYSEIWEEVDPLTAPLRQKRCPSLAEEVIKRSELERTDFYHGFLKANDMFHGINVYFFKEGRDVGDLRIWRAQDMPHFGAREVSLLTTLEPFFVRGLNTPTESLTPREREVVRLVVTGLSDKEVARSLEIGFTTVRSHLNRAMDKLKCANRTELTARIRN
ncbi:response regulator transcription factor [Pantoea sp. App145]|uniref:response regulator transcription factor n=1 Tax=Pantoea sp. App145 TaxID=3071567 RepID=UPI003A809098